MFDRVVVVDWSASSTPTTGRDSIWIAVVDAGATDPIARNVSTRHEAERFLVDLVEESGAHRTLIGVDFSLGYPSGTAAALGLTGTPWRAMWGYLDCSIDDDDRNRNNRFGLAAAMNAALGGGPGPFWGCPPSAATATLTATKPSMPAGLAEWRTVEARLRSAGLRPFSAWQLLGAGSVGSQSLVGVPVMARLRRRFDQRVHVWPFTTGLQAPDVARGDVVVAEVWPSMRPIDVVDGRVRDRAQVEATSRWLRDLAGAGRLRDLFAPSCDPAWAAAVVDEEGWVLGVDAPTGTGDPPPTVAAVGPARTAGGD
jgi:hypothetical protein